MTVYKCSVADEEQSQVFERLFSNKQSALKWSVDLIKKNEWILWDLDGQRPFIDILHLPDELDSLEKALQPIVNISEVEVFD